MGVLDELMVTARQRVADLPPRGARRSTGEVLTAKSGRFRAALAGRGEPSIIAEFKRRSPSLGIIREDVAVATQVRAYQEGGAKAISVLTEPSRFGGSFADLEAVVRAVDLPVLMKDFLVDPAQVEVAAELGAAAVLLIVRCLAPEQLRELYQACEECGLEALVECHSRPEIERALQLDGARSVLGVNCRNLDSLQMDVDGRGALLGEVPADRVLIAESGIERPEEVQQLRGHADGVLIGTALMRSSDPRRFLREALS